MALTYEQFLELSGAEVVCGNLIVGQLAERKIVGSVLDGTFQLNEAGQELSAELEAGTATKGGRRKKADDAASADAAA
jgi:hypothetical protein